MTRSAASSPVLSGRSDEGRLLTHRAAPGSANCLTTALQMARRGDDEILFLSRIDDDDEEGHVVLRDRHTGAVREPGTEVGLEGSDAARYAALHGFAILGAVEPSDIDALLALAVPERSAALAGRSDTLAQVAGRRFGISGNMPTPSTSDIPPPPPPPSTETSSPDEHDTRVQAWLDALGDAEPQPGKDSLAQTANDLETLGVFLYHNPGAASMPQNVADAESRLLADPAVAKRIKSDSGEVTFDAVNDLSQDLDGAADSAKASWESFKKDNPNADSAALGMAVDTNIVQGFLPILDTAGSDGAQLDGLIDINDLNAVGYEEGVPFALADAARFEDTAGEVSHLDIGGDKPSTPADGLIDNANIDAYLANDTSKSEDDTISSLRNDALQQAIQDAGGDASKVNGDYFKDPSSSDATGADKAAALVQLSQTLARYNAGEQTYVSGDNSPNILHSPDAYHENWGNGPTPGQQRDQFVKDMKDRITTLAQDKDVQSFMSDKVPHALQGIVSADPGLKATIGAKLFAEEHSPDGLAAAFDAKDKDGNPLSTTDALSLFLSNPSFYAQALGVTPDFSGALDGAPQAIKDKVNQGYDDITSGKDIDDLIKSGKSPEQAMIQSAVDKTAYDSVLDKGAVQAGTDRFNDVTAKLGRAQLTDGMSGDAMLKGLGFTGVDDPKLAQFIQNNLDQLAAPGKDQPPTSAILAGVRQVVDLMRNGLKFDDAMAKVNKDRTPWFGTGQHTDAYKAGVFHGVSALFLAGAMGARLATSGNSSPIQTAQQSLGVAGLLAEGGGKYYGTTLGDLNSKYKADKARLEAFSDQNLDYDPLKKLVDSEKAALDKLTNIGKDVENVGKTLGGVAGNALGLITGAIGAAGSAASGDIGAAAAQGTFAGLNGLSMVASAGEVATYIAPRVATAFGSSLSSEATASLTYLGGLAGTAGSLIGGAAAIGGIIYSIVSSIQADQQKTEDEADWYSQLQDGFAPSGLSLPDEDTLISAPNGYVPDDGTSPVAY